MSNGYVPYSDVYYDRDYRDSDRRPDRSRTRYEPAENTAGAQWQQLSDFNQPGRRRSELSAQNLDDHRRDSHGRYLRERSADDAYYSRRRRRQDSYDSRSEDSEYDSEPDDRQRRRGDNNNTSGRRAQSEKRPGEGRPNSGHYDGDLKGLVEKNVDLSPDGALFAALGAGVGAIAARRFGGNHFSKKDGSQNWQTIAGAVVGGVGANVAAKKFTSHREQKKVEQDYSNLENDEYERPDNSRRKRYLQQ